MDRSQKKEELVWFPRQNKQMMRTTTTKITLWSPLLEAAKEAEEAVGWATGIGGKERKDNLKSITNYKEHQNDATDTDSWLKGL